MNSAPFKNCDDRDDCQYPDCGCPISFSNVASNPADTGTMIVTHGTDGAVTVMVRSPQSAVESTITMPLADWWSMVGLSTPSVSKSE